jgi:hypothetical protein
MMKIMDNNVNNVLINENITLEPALLNLVNILDENESLPLIEDNINLDNLMKFDFKKVLSFNLNPNYKEALIKINKNEVNCTSPEKNENPTLLGKKRNLIKDTKITEDKKEMLKNNIISR